ncbi:MAG: glycosyltransferase family 4 protein [Betaproteobacteria bacterium]
MLLLAIVLAAVLSFAFNALAVRGIGVRAPLDLPNERSLHTRPVPRVGGLGIVAGVVASLLATSAFGLTVSLAVALAVLSLVDDWRQLPVAARLSGHLSAAVVYCVVAVAAEPVALIALIVAVGWMTNLYNFMDGSDGLAGGMAAIGFGTYGLAAWTAGDAELAGLCGCIVAASIAFLRFNFQPARIFMGDVGSIPLGFLAAVLGIEGVIRGAWPGWFPAVVFAPFIVDASVTLLRRIARREKVWRAHRSHYYQRLVLMGWGHRRTALAEYVLMSGTGAAALLAARLPTAGQVGILGVLVLAYTVLAFSVDRRWSAFAGAQGS